jgi:parallel beta-helix repeat protein
MVDRRTIMRKRIVKIATMIVTALFLTSSLLSLVATVIKQNGFEIENESLITDEPISDMRLEPHGTRSDYFEGTIFDGATYDHYLYKGYKWCAGLKFTVNDNCTVDQLGVNRGYYPYQFYSLRLWTETGDLLAEIPNPYVAKYTWGWFDILPVNLVKGNTYIASIGLRGYYIMGVDNPGQSPDGLINSLEWTYNLNVYGFPNSFASSAQVPLIDIHYHSNTSSYDLIVPDDYSTIQSAIDAANENDTIYVRENSSEYNEKLIINKSINLVGENSETTVINASGIPKGSGAVVYITADNVKIRGFTITGGYHGIYLKETTGAFIWKNNIINNYISGVYCNQTNESSFIYNHITNNYHYGIYLDRCYETQVNNNEIRDNNDYGIYLDNSNNDTINANQISGPNLGESDLAVGLFASDSQAKGVWRNLISNNKIGVKILDSWLWGCVNWNTFIENDIAIDYDPEPIEIDGNEFINNRIAIKITGDDSPVMISNNNISGSEIGIYLISGSPVIENNRFKDNEYGLLYLDDSTPNIINNTFEDNTYNIHHEFQAEIDIDPNTLNLKSKGKWVTCYIELPESLDVSDIDLTTISLNDALSYSPIKHPGYSIGDHDDDGVLDLMIKFPRDEVEDITGGPQDSFDIKISGSLKDGSDFEGYDTIRVIRPGK